MSQIATYLRKWGDITSDKKWGELFVKTKATPIFEVEVEKRLQDFCIDLEPKCIRHVTYLEGSTFYSFAVDIDNEKIVMAMELNDNVIFIMSVEAAENIFKYKSETPVDGRTEQDIIKKILNLDIFI